MNRRSGAAAAVRAGGILLLAVSAAVSCTLLLVAPPTAGPQEPGAVPGLGTHAVGPPPPPPDPAAGSGARTVGSPWRWEGIERIVAVGDVHGATAELGGLLRAAGIVNEQGSWSGGTAHLVAVGDLIDRGAGSRAVLDLLMRLQEQARAAGGAVHVLLGNHEVMNVTGDLRYVSAEDCAAFVAEEHGSQRAAALRRAKQNAAQNGVGAGPALAAFQARYPPGYFGRREAFSSRGVYGRWILQLPVAVVLNGTAFVHGGAGRAFGDAARTAAEAGHDPLDALMETARAELKSFLDAERELQSDGLLQPETTLAEGLGITATLLARHDASGITRGRVTARILDAAARYAAVKDSLLFRADGPLWYRSGTDESVEAPRLDAVLSALRARRLVVGHTPTSDHRVTPMFEGRLVAIDTGMLRSVYEGRPAALILEGDRASVLYLGEPEQALALDPRPSPAPAQRPAPAEALPSPKAADPAAAPAPPATPSCANDPGSASSDAAATRPAQAPAAAPDHTAAPPSAALSDAEIEEFLKTAEVVKKERIGTGITRPWRLTLRRGGVERRAAFKTIHEEVLGMVHAGGGVQMSHADKFVFEVAAYRLDRLIGLDMVPVTVERTVDGEAGSVMDWVENSVPEMRRKADGLEPADPAVLERQQERMRLFDVLIYNTDRNPTNVLVTPADWKVHLIDHSRSFRLESRPPESLKGVAIPVAPDLRPGLAALTLPGLKSHLGDLLSTEQLKAVLKRRDWILRQAGPDSPGGAQPAGAAKGA